MAQITICPLDELLPLKKPSLTSSSASFADSDAQSNSSQQLGIGIWIEFLGIWIEFLCRSAMPSLIPLSSCVTEESKGLVSQL